jgi:hypothetical protein
VFADVYMEGAGGDLAWCSPHAHDLAVKRLNYMVLREVSFEEIYLDPGVAKTLLDSAVAIADALSNAGSVERAA